MKAFAQQQHIGHHVLCPLTSTVISIYTTLSLNAVQWTIVRFPFLDTTITRSSVQFTSRDRKRDVPLGKHCKHFEIWNTGVVLLRKAMLSGATRQLCNFCSSLVGNIHLSRVLISIYIHTHLQINHSHKLRGRTNHVGDDQLQIQSRHRQGGDEHIVDTHRDHKYIDIHASMICFYPRSFTTITGTPSPELWMTACILYHG